MWNNDRNGNEVKRFSIFMEKETVWAFTKERNKTLKIRTFLRKTISDNVTQDRYLKLKKKDHTLRNLTVLSS